MVIRKPCRGGGGVDRVSINTQPGPPAKIHLGTDKNNVLVGRHPPLGLRLQFLPGYIICLVLLDLYYVNNPMVVM